MVEVVTGNKDLKFRCQGKMASHDKPIRVRPDHNVQCKLNDGSLKVYKKPAPKLVPPPKPKEESKVTVKKETKKVSR